MTTPITTTEPATELLIGPDGNQISANDAAQLIVKSLLDGRCVWYSQAFFPGQPTMIRVTGDLRDLE